jgi:LysM repeat protein
MKALRSVMIASLAVAVIALVMVAAPAQGAPVEQSNLLRNGDFESGSYPWNGDPDRLVPDEWAAWWDNALAPPRYNPTESSHRVQSGARAASYWEQYLNYDAGLYQLVVNTTPGTIYRFQAYGHAWSTTDNAIGTSDTDVAMQIGIDPNGETNPFSPSVVWSGTISARDSYQLFAVEAQANNVQVTVFLRGRTTYPVTQTDFYWDNASLVAVGAGEPTAKPTDKPSSGGGSSGVPAGSIPKSTPAPDGSVVHIVKKGETLIGIALTYDVTLEDLRKLNNLKGDTIYVGQTLVIKLPTGSEPEPEEEEPEEEAEGEEAEEAEAEEPPPSEEEPSEVAEASGNGTICVMGYEDSNGNGIREPEEVKLAGITFALSDGANTIGTYTTDGVSEPHCFTELLPGTYIVSWVADTFSATTDQTWAASVAAGATVSHEFGAVPSGSLGEEEGSKPGKEGSGGLPKWAIALVGGLGAILFLGGLGAAGYFFILRRQVDIE